MANHREVLSDRYIAFSGIGLQQTAQGTPLDNADIDTRDKCVITREDIIVRRDQRDCKDKYLIESKTVSRLARLSLNYTELTPQLIARFTAYFLGGSAAPTGTPANEVQTLTVSADGTISLTLEGRTVTTKTIPSAGITAAKVQAALTAARMEFIQPGDVVVTGGSSPFTLTFPQTGRLGRANLPLLVGTGGMAITASANGAQNHHVLTESTTRDKAKISFIMGWDDPSSSNVPEKYADYVCEAITPTISLDGNVGMTVTLLGPWDYDSEEADYDAPACVNIDALQAQDCRINIASVWQTTDINTLNLSVNDNIPTDRLSAFPFEGQDVQYLQERGRQPGRGPNTASIFGSEIDTIYQLPKNERTEDPVPVLVHFGYPGNRCTWNFPKSKVRFQTNRAGEAGDARYSTVNIEMIPFEDGSNPPFNSDAYLDQTDQFLDTP